MKVIRVFRPSVSLSLDSMLNTDYFTERTCLCQSAAFMNQRDVEDNCSVEQLTFQLFIRKRDHTIKLVDFLDLKYTCFGLTGT